MTKTKEPGKLVTVSSEDEYKAALAQAKGPVVLEFVMDGCGACEEQKPEIEALVQQCPDVTIIRADVDKLAGLADSFDCEATPTLLYANKPEKMVPGKAVEVEDALKLKRRIKCSR